MSHTPRPIIAPAPYDDIPTVAGLPFDSEPGYLVRRLHQIATSIFLDQCKALAVTPVQYAAMTAIGQRPGCDQQTVARLTAIDRTTINLVTAKLEQRAWLVRLKTGKRISLSLTEAGEAVVREMGTATEAHSDMLLAPLLPAEREQFRAFLLKLVHHNNDLSRVPVG